jgi:hypothetical protein
VRKTFWIVLLLCTYIWVITSGHEQFFLDQSKRLYQTVTTWFDDAEVDFQVQQQKPLIVKKKKPRRWD